MIKPNPTTGMRHVALFVKNYEATEHFYVELLGMAVEWRPDSGAVYLTSGNDNLALHRVDHDFADAQHLGHIGFFLNAMDDVDEWFDFLRGHDITMKTEPRTHRDGARSFYCLDPDGNTVQMICHPPMVIAAHANAPSSV
ncbi:MAG: VOC family protein [Gammaproteobacteria bacterium]|nr:VOC family protein [Gammaproteobacteria bacterium]